jgi:hypothetical protein
MELLDRYLNFIRFLLPRGKQQDIIDELSEDLHAQIADKEAELGRALNTPELEAVLKQCGHPLLVAGRYQPQQQLIGQPFFPLYLFALKAVQWALLPLMLVVGAFMAMFRSQPFIALIGSIGDAFMSCIYIVGVLTVAFIVLEKLQTRLTFLEDWKPGELPKVPVVPDPLQIPRTASFGGFAGLLLFILWWLGLIGIPQIPHVHFLKVIPGGFFWPVLLLAAAEMLLYLVNLFLPWWTRKRAAFRLVLDVCSLALLVALATTWPWFSLQIDASAQLDVTPSARDVAVLEQVVNLSLLISLGIMALSYLPRTLQDLRRTLGRPPIRNPLLVLFDFVAGKR